MKIKNIRAAIHYERGKELSWYDCVAIHQSIASILRIYGGMMDVMEMRLDNSDLGLSSRVYAIVKKYNRKEVKREQIA